MHPSRLRWQFAHAALLGMLASGALAAEAEHAGHAEHAEAVELAPMVITGVGQQSPLTVVTDPKIPRQPMPASDGADYLRSEEHTSELQSLMRNSYAVLCWKQKNK